MAAHHRQRTLAAGASEICLGDLTDYALTIATKLGAHRVVKIAQDETLTPNADVVFEATGFHRR